MRPDVYLFNPTCEYAVANGTTSWQPNLLLQKMEAELATLPVFFSKPGDIILVKEKPPETYILSLAKLGIKNRRFITSDTAFSGEFIKTEKINRLLPWGWSPATHHFLGPLKTICSGGFRESPNFQWDENYKKLSGKSYSLKILKQVIGSLKPGILLPEEMAGHECYSVNEIEKLLNQWGEIMVKAPWSTSGRGLQPVTRKPIHPSVKKRINGMLKEQGFVIVEPLLNKAGDMAFQFISQNGDIRHLGISCFKTDSKGQYRGNYLNGCPNNIFADTNPSIIPSIITELKKIFINEGYAEKYEGFFGVDVLIYSDRKGELKINPCLEINLRYNMGVLSFYLEKLITKGVKAMFHIYYKPGTSFNEFSKKMQHDFPTTIYHQKIYSGFLPLTASGPNTDFGAYILAAS